ncbi:MAG: hypothetical protein M3Y42_09380 [Actinomycetota bacterium]|nr:hypothetical protein [Actinomycetota bacterium]MDQ2957161.1 hypothetical protein [Actinomycetota bacterium]
MLKKIVIAGSAAAVVLGAGTAAMAASGSSSPSPAPSASSTGKAAKADHGKKDQLKRALHATWVTKAGKGSTSYVTHDAIRGSVTAVSATSITVKAADNVSETYTVNSTTKVHSRADGKGKAGTMSEVKSGDKVMVLGTGTSSLTATHVLDGTKK